VTALLYLAVLAFFLALFAVGTLNDTEVTIRLLGRTIGPMTLGAALSAAAIAGVAFASLLGLLEGIRIRVANRQLRRQLRRAEEESDALRLRLARPPAPAPGDRGSEPFRSSTGRDPRVY
jgi:uncharacterized membrane protein YciS (DUF1049 family)